MERARATDRVALVVLTTALGCGITTALVACSSSSSSSSGAGAVDASAAPDTSTDAAVEAGAACTLPGRFGAPKCDTCVLAQCCAQLGACAADPSCDERSKCILGCIEQPDAGGCADDCRAKTHDDAGLWTALEKCAYFSQPCTFECAVSPQH